MTHSEHFEDQHALPFVRGEEWGESAFGVHPGCGSFPGRGEGIRLQRQVAVPGADGGALGHGPLLEGLAAGADHAPDFLTATRRKHGLQMRVGASAGKTRPDGVRIEFFHSAVLADLRRTHKAACAPGRNEVQDS